MCTTEEYLKCQSSIHIKNQNEKIEKIEISLKENVNLLHDKIDKMNARIITFTFSVMGSAGVGILIYLLSK